MLEFNQENKARTRLPESTQPACGGAYCPQCLLDGFDPGAFPKVAKILPRASLIPRWRHLFEMVDGKTYLAFDELRLYFDASAPDKMAERSTLILCP